METLALNINRISRLPSEIARLTKLHTLLIGGNQLQELPSSIGQLSGLQRLSLSGNCLQELPPEIGSLTGLKYLNLSRTQIKELPRQMTNLTMLEELDLNDNIYFEGIPKRVFKREPAEMIRFILAWQEGTERADGYLHPQGEGMTEREMTSQPEARYAPVLSPAV